MGLLDTIRARQENARQEEAQRKALLLEQHANNVATSITPQDDNQTRTTLDQNSDLHRWQQQLKQDIEALCFEFGYETLPDGTMVERNDDTTICNKKCIAKIKTMLTPMHGRSTPNSNITNDWIYNTMRRNLDALCIDLGTHLEEYEIKTISDAKRIKQAVEKLMFLILSRSKEGWNKRTDASVRKIVETPQPDTTTTKRGFFGVF